MNTHKAIFISANETIGNGDDATVRSQGPVLYCIHAPILRSFIELHGATPPKAIISDCFSSGPIIWDKALSTLTFICWYWRCASREWKSARFYSVQQAAPFFDGSTAYSLTSIGEPNEERLSVQAIPLSLGAMSKLVYEVEVNHQFAMVAKKGIAMFTDFDAFEHKFLSSMEDLHRGGTVKTARPPKRHRGR